MADHACAAPREERLAEERKLLDAAVKANPCHFGALQSRAAVHLELKMSVLLCLAEAACSMWVC